MAEVKGKFIHITGSLMSLYPDALQQADNKLYAETGKRWNTVEMEGWYPCAAWGVFMDGYVHASPTKERALITLGKQIYPTIQRTAGLPASLKTPLDFIQFEAEGFLANHRGPSVKPRRFLTLEDRNIVVEATAPNYNSALYAGVYQGLLEIAGVKTGKVIQTKRQDQGHAVSEFHISW
jgi:hypothetical protein